jgi:hypothetical protein
MHPLPYTSCFPRSYETCEPVAQRFVECVRRVLWRRALTPEFQESTADEVAAIDLTQDMCPTSGLSRTA